MELLRRVIIEHFDGTLQHFKNRVGKQAKNLCVSEKEELGRRVFKLLRVFRCIGRGSNVEGRGIGGARCAYWHSSRCWAEAVIQKLLAKRQKSK